MTPPSIKSILKSPNEQDIFWRLLYDAFKSELGVDDTIAAAASDAYWIHYLMMPQLDEARRDMLHYTPFEKYMSSKEYESLHRLTTYSDILSKYYAVKLVEELKKELQNEPQQDQQQGQQQDPRAARARFQAALQNALQNAAAACHRAATAENKLRTIGTSLSDIIKKWKKEQEGEKGGKPEPERGEREQGEPQNSWGLEPGELKFMSEAMQRLDVLIKRLEAVGNLKIDLSVHIAKIEGKRGEEVRGYRMTRNPAEALPHELALAISNPAVFASKLSSGWLARTMATPSIGPIVLALDKSGSMSGYKIAWAANVALNIALIARRRGAPFKYFFFDSDVYGPYGINDADKMLLVNANGGTNIHKVLVDAIPLARNGTVILVSDGISEVHIDEIQRLKKQYNVKVLCYFIGVEENESVRHACDSVSRVQATPSGALKIVEDVRRL